MIRLRKGEEPRVLVENGADWLLALSAKVDAGETPTDYEKTRYRHPEIKEALKRETHGKCAYCESYLLHVAFGDVEHISPKSSDIADTFRWENLTLACDVCNTNKGNARNLVDPYTEEPADFFSFVGPLIYAVPEKVKGVATHRKLKLNRTELVLSRARRLEAISNILLIIENQRDEDLRAILIEDLLLNETADATEYAAFVRSFLRTIALKVVEPEVGVELRM